MWKGYVVLKEGSVVTVRKETLMEALEYISQNYYLRASNVFVFEVEEGAKE